MPALKGKWESVLSGRHMDNVPKETHAVSVLTMASGSSGKGSHENSKAMTEGEKNPQKNQATERLQ